MPGVILVVKTHAFGDALVATPAVGRLTDGPSPVWVLAGPSSAPVWDRMPGIERVIVAPAPPRGAYGRIRLAAWTLARIGALRGVSRSIVLHCSPVVRRWVRLLTGAPMTSAGASALGPWEEVAPIDTRAFAGMSFARVAGVSPSDFRPVFPVREDEAAEAAEILGSGAWLSMAPGGGRNPRDTVGEKRWNPAGFAATASRARAAGLGVVLLGDEGDESAADEVVRLAGCGGILDLTGRTGWGLTAAILAGSRAFVGPDSGTAHLACATGTPAVVLFGPTDPAALYAPGMIVPVRSTHDCAPCYSNEAFPGCSSGRHDCMFAIEPGQVWSALKGLLDADCSC